MLYIDSSQEKLLKVGKDMILLKLLNEKGISKLQLALKCQITPSDLYSAIKGKKPFYPKWKHKITQYLGVSEDVIFDGTKLKIERIEENGNN